MGIQQIPDQVKKAPALGLRAVFSGIGRILMSADRPQASATAAPADTKPAADGRRQSARRPRQATQAVPESRWRSLDQTGNVRLLSPEDLDEDLDAGPAAGASAVVAAEPAPELPLPGYDLLSLASIRARLRGLDIAQLRILLEHESKNAERPEVLGMFERRIAKLEIGE